jgi:hypothetical protein
VRRLEENLSGIDALGHDLRSRHDSPSAPGNY